MWPHIKTPKSYDRFLVSFSLKSITAFSYWQSISFSICQFFDNFQKKKGISICVSRSTLFLATTYINFVILKQTPRLRIKKWLQHTRVNFRHIFSFLLKNTNFLFVSITPSSSVRFCPMIKYTFVRVKTIN